jgi:subtilisin family serine protease
MGHPEFAGRIVSGYDFVNEDADASDDQGHGTHVAGILAAAMDNGHGSVGIAPGVRIMPVKVINASGSGLWSDIAQGIVYAADHGAQIINLSLGGPVASQVLSDAVRYAAERGAFLVAAAGNAASSSPFYPAAYPEVLAVSGTTATDEVWPHQVTAVTWMYPRPPRRSGAPTGLRPSRSPTPRFQAPRWRRRTPAAWPRCCFRSVPI